MRSRYLLLAVLTSSCLVAGALQQAAEPRLVPSLTIRDIGRGDIAIDGDWQFHLGDDMHWIDPAYDDSQWEPIRADKTWGEQTHPGYAGFAWYRRHLDITPPISYTQKLAILMPPVDSAYEIYWNGEKIGHQGVLPPGAVWYYGHREPHISILRCGHRANGVPGQLAGWGRKHDRFSQPIQHRSSHRSQSDQSVSTDACVTADAPTLRS